MCTGGTAEAALTYPVVVFILAILMAIWVNDRIAGRQALGVQLTLRKRIPVGGQVRDVRRTCQRLRPRTRAVVNDDGLAGALRNARRGNGSPPYR